MKSMPVNLGAIASEGSSLKTVSGGLSVQQEWKVKNV
jgi:hypothetical protein